MRAWIAWLVAPVCLGIAAVCRGQTTLPADAPVEVREWVIFVCDPYQSNANDQAMPTSTLPPEVDTLRAAAPPEQRNDPFPVGVIRLTGPPGAKADVMLQMKGGRFLASWPKGQQKTDRLLWPGVQIAAEPANPTVVGKAYWFNQLRAADTSWLNFGGEQERFLLYDRRSPIPFPCNSKAARTSSFRSQTPASRGCMI
jgi:hypothetical protein